MEQYTIAIDASVDIEESYLKENGITLIPMKYMLGGKECVLEKRLTEDEMHAFYDAMRDGAPVSTSQITPFFYEEVFGREAAAGNNVLYLSLSGGLSNTYNSACSAVQDLKEDYPDFQAEVVDTLAATGGMGLLLIKAVEGRAQGLSLAENAAKLRDLAKKVCHWFFVDDLVYLRRGGRISAATAIAGAMLNIKPVLRIDEEGKLISFSKQRGLPRVKRFLAEEFEAAKEPALGHDVVLIHADCEDRIPDLRDKVLAADPEAKIHICSLSPIIGAHTGPGMMAGIHFGKRDLTL